MTTSQPKKKATKPKTAAKPRAPRRTVRKPAGTTAHGAPPAVQDHAVPSHRPHPRLTYTFAIGRRKTAIARVRYSEKGSGLYLVNGQDVSVYFPTFEMRTIVNEPFEVTKFARTGDISVKVHGGGKHGQAEAVRLGLSRLLVSIDHGFRIPLKRAGFMTRDPRAKERKKYGLKRARRAPQWQKR